MIVPALVAVRGYRMKAAAGTSLLAIGFTAVFGTVYYGIAGDVRWREALLVGLPAVAGAGLGTSLQQRISGRQLQLWFAALVALIGVKLLVSP